MSNSPLCRKSFTNPIAGVHQFSKTHVTTETNPSRCLLQFQGQSCRNLTEANLFRASHTHTPPTPQPQGSSGSHLDSSICLLQLPPPGRGRALALQPEYRGSRGITRVRFSHFLPSHTQGSDDLSSVSPL